MAGTGVVQEQDGSSSLTYSSSPHPNNNNNFSMMMPTEVRSDERGFYLLRHLLLCATHVASGSFDNANIALDRISLHASPDGDAMQRIAAYFTEALARRLLKTWRGLDKALNSTRILSSLSDRILVHRLFFDLCPFLKLSYLVTNQAILEAMEGEKVVHVIDLCAAEPAQWLNLLQSLSNRRGGPPHLKITGIHQQRQVLDQMALRLTQEAEKLDIPFRFNRIVSKLEDLDFEKLGVKTGEALAISSVLQLHSLLATDEDEPPQRRNPNYYYSQKAQTTTLGEWLGKSASPDSTLLASSSSPKMGSFLSSLCALSPKLMVITEQESNQNGSALMDRVLEALNFYAAIFDCLESTIPRTSIERQKLEKMMFGEEIKNIIACEGIERKERHEKLEKWSLRLEVSGFKRVCLSYSGMLQAGRLLQSYGCDGYNIKEDSGCFFLCWQERPLFSVSAWRFDRC